MRKHFLEKFNKTLKDLVHEIQESFPETWEAWITEEFRSNLEDTGDAVLCTYYKHATEVGIELSEKHEIIFSEEITLLPGVYFHKIWNAEISEEIQDHLWKYLHTMYLYADHYSRDSNLADLIKQYKKATQKEHNEVDRQTQIMFGILDNLCGDRLVKRRSEKELEAVDVSTTDTTDTSATMEAGRSTGSNKTTIPGLEDIADNPILGGSIGKLAGEIASEIDPSDFQIGDPNQMIQGLLSGKLDKDSPMLKMVNTINSKIQSKLSTGELNEMDLFKEAQGMMSTLGATGDGNSPFSLFANLGKMASTSDPASAPESAPTSSAESTINQSTEKSQMLKEKLRRKKKLLRAKRKMNS